MSDRHSVAPDLVSRYGNGFTIIGAEDGDTIVAECDKCRDPALFFGNEPFCIACDDTQACLVCGAPMTHENWISLNEWSCPECGEME